ncbi:MAG: hypothetical protein HC853_02095 [Anaerolineae bacterium]|nr:hypothetical protein [Anaerolineae bacterium]
MSGSLLLNYARLLKAERINDRGMGGKFVIIALPCLLFILALAVNQKSRHYYVSTALPFFALHVALAVQWLWPRAARQVWLRAGLLAIGAGLLIESGVGIARHHAIAQATKPYEAVLQPIAAHIPPGTRVLLSQPYWLGLADRETRSVVLALDLVDSRLFPPNSGQLRRTMPQAFDLIQPDFVLIEEQFIVGYTNPTNPEIEAGMRAFAEVLRERCPTRVDTWVEADYGTIHLFRCP